MTRFRLALLPAILMVLTFTITSAAAFTQFGASNQDKAQACKEMADKRNLSGDDRKNFLQNCLSKASDSNNAGQNKAQQTANNKLDDMSQRDKLNGCENLADKKGLKGSNRRSYVRDCMDKANPK